MFKEAMSKINNAKLDLIQIVRKKNERSKGYFREGGSAIILIVI